MRKITSLLMAATLVLSIAGCAQLKPAQETPPSVTAPTVSEPAPTTVPTPDPSKPGPLPAPAVKPDARQLFPAYAFVDGSRKWGYVDPKGQFVIKPTFDSAADFESDGLAIVRLANKYGLVNKDGRQVAEPVWESIRPANSDLVRVLSNSSVGKVQVVDSAGKLLFDTYRIHDNFNSGLVPFQEPATSLYGYVNRAGEVVIPAQYQRGYAFRDGKAIVSVSEGTFAVIDTADKRLGAFTARMIALTDDGVSEDLIAYSDASGQWGYVTVSGQVVVPAKYGYAGPFKDGRAVVSAGASWDRKPKGLINTRGEVVIPEEYGNLEPLGAGLYAVAKPTEFRWPEAYMPTALMTAEGRLLTEFKYYNVQPVDQGLISVNDGKETFFLDTQGKRAPGLPSAEGFGKVQVAGSLIKADVDDRVRYLDRKGQVVWQGDHTVTLAGGLRVIERKYRPNRSTLIFYPEFAGLADPKAQEAVNKAFRPEGMDLPKAPGEETHSTVNMGFSVRQLKGLAIIYETSYWYGWGAAHGMPGRVYTHVDAKTGKIYSLADLFKTESNYTARLREIVRKQIAARQDKLFAENPEVRVDHPFYVTEEALTIYYVPYEIASYAQGFIEFAIPWSEISELTETNGPFWKSFH
ncbi:MAG: repeat-containing protein [Symbiobacteriaceae bacterium]|jgi:hypothetical protein|nr:repeat-containing protein [Symbiobacteriaceae bacterium]